MIPVAKQFLKELSKVVIPEVWKLVCPRRYVPPRGYANPKINSAWVAAKIEISQSHYKLDKTQVDGSLCAFKLVECSMPTIFVAEDFVEALTLTDPPDNMEIKDLEWPFEAVTFVLPDAWVRRRLGRYAPFMRVCRHATGAHFPPAVFRPYLPFVRSIGVGERPDGYGWFMAVTTLADDDTFDYSASYHMDTTVGTILTDGRFIDYTEGDTPEMVETDMKFLNHCCSVCLHLLLALNAVPEMLEAPQLQRKARVKRGLTVKEELWTPHLFGRQYVWHRDHTPQGGTHASPRLHPRRGHWRHQPHGPGRKQRKVIWIRPTLVGVDPNDCTQH